MKGELMEMQCCGVLEYYGINHSDIAVDDMLLDIIIEREFDGLRSAHVIFNTVVSGENTDDYATSGSRRLAELTRLINAEDFGTILTSSAKRNPNSGNWVKCSVFTPKFGKIQQWAQHSGRWEQAVEDRRYQRDRWGFDRW